MESSEAIRGRSIIGDVSIDDTIEDNGTSVKQTKIRSTFVLLRLTRDHRPKKDSFSKFGKSGVKGVRNIVLMIIIVNIVSPYF